MTTATKSRRPLSIIKHRSIAYRDGARSLTLDMDGDTVDVGYLHRGRLTYTADARCSCGEALTLPQDHHERIRCACGAIFKLAVS